MAKIGPSTGTKGEVLLARWYGKMPRARVNNRAVVGSPDVTFWHSGTLFALFVDGRFWHDPKFAALKQRSHHTMDWVAKAKRNQARDRKVNRELRKGRTVVIRIWDECFSGKNRTMNTRARLNKVILRAEPGDRWAVSKRRTQVWRRR